MRKEADLKYVLEGIRMEMDVQGYISTNEADFLIDTCKALLKENKQMKKKIKEEGK